MAFFRCLGNYRFWAVDNYGTVTATSSSSAKALAGILVGRALAQFKLYTPTTRWCLFLLLVNFEKITMEQKIVR